MSRSKNSGKRRGGRDLWKPGALSGISHSAENKRLARRIDRKRRKREDRKDSDAAN